MNSIEAIQYAVVSCGKSRRVVSAEMGRSANFLSSAIGQAQRNGGDLNTPTLIAAANACGYALALVPFEDLPESALTITP